TGRRDALASPSAVNAADRSSILTCSRTRSARSSAQNAMASGVEREPGATTTSRSPHRASSSASTVASAVDGFTGPAPAARGRSLLLSRGELRARPRDAGQELGGGQGAPPPRLRVGLPAREGVLVDRG